MSCSTTIILHAQICKLRIKGLGLCKMNPEREVHNKRTHCSNIVTIYITSRKKHLTQEEKRGNIKGDEYVVMVVE